MSTGFDHFQETFDGEDPNSFIAETEDEHQHIIDALGEADDPERDPVALTKKLVAFWNEMKALA